MVFLYLISYKPIQWKSVQLVKVVFVKKWKNPYFSRTFLTAILYRGLWNCFFSSHPVTSTFSILFLDFYSHFFISLLFPFSIWTFKRKKKSTRFQFFFDSFPFLFQFLFISFSILFQSWSHFGFLPNLSSVLCFVITSSFGLIRH